MCWGGCDHNYSGEVIASMAYNLKGVKNAVQAELCAIWKGILLARELHLSHYILESNSAPVVQRINEGKEDLSPLRYMVGSIQELGRDYPNFTLKYASRKVNVPTFVG